MTDHIALLKEFHDAFEVKRFIDGDAYDRKKTANLRCTLIGEEYKEVVEELLDMYNGDGSISRLAKELADLLYVVYGTAEVYEIPIDAVFEEVHRSNMSKLEDGKPVRRKDGKIIKGKHYVEPDIDRILLGGLDDDSEVTI